MKAYEIRNEESGSSIGVLLYYDKKKTFIIELSENLDEWTAPLLFTGFVRKNIFTIPAEISLMWVKERLIPAGRQNIGSILNNHRMKEYDEMKFLEISGGRCSQDYLYIQKVSELPEYVLKRMKKNLKECVVTGNSILCFFADDTIRKIDLKELTQCEDIGKILGNRQLMESGKVGVGGYCADFGESIEIPASVLYESGVQIPLSVTDFLDFVKKNIYDTTESCSTLECSRQNIAYMQGRSFAPIKENVKGSLFLRGDILRAGW